MGYGNSLRKNEAVHWFIGSSVHRFIGLSVYRSRAMVALGALGECRGDQMKIKSKGTTSKGMNPEPVNLPSSLSFI